jgi:hypothetical protein
MFNSEWNGALGALRQLFSLQKIGMSKMTVTNAESGQYNFFSSAFVMFKKLKYERLIHVKF